MFEIIVWDDRDTDATEPESSLGSFFTLEQAERALADYRVGEHGSHIYRFQIIEKD